MRRLALAITLATVAALGAVGAGARPQPDCPAVKVSCPNKPVRSGESVTFSATVDGADPGANLTYNWVANAGSISSGQGTASVVVDTTGIPGNFTLTATVEVAGLSASCPRSTSCSMPLVAVIIEDRLDEYGNITFEHEQARLDNFAVELQNWPEGTGYIIAYGGRVGRRGEAMRRAERAKRYLVNVRHVPAGQVVLIDGGYHEHLTLVLKLKARGVPPPPPGPTVEPKDVQFIEARPKRRVRH